MSVLKALALVAFLAVASASAPSSPEDAVLSRVRFSPAAGARLPLDAVVVDETGRRLRFGDVIAGMPAVLVFAYTRCPMLCPEVFDGLLRALRGLSLRPGVDYRVVAASFDPRDTPRQATARVGRLAALTDRPGGPRAWFYLTGEDGVARLARAAGFSAAYDPAIGQYAHAAGILVLTPSGRVSRAFFGVEYSPADLRWALLEASGGRVGSWGDRVLFYCYRYDPRTGRYGVAIMRLLRACAVLTAAALAGSILALSRRR